MAIDVDRLSWWDTLRLQLEVGALAFLLGLVVPNRFFLAWFARRDVARAPMRFLGGLRERYHCGHLWTWFPFRRTLVVLDPQTIDAVLASADNAADPFLKARALSRFVPDALVISSGAQWRERRDFNEAILATGTLHRHHDAFLAIVAREAAAASGSGARDWRWPEFQSLAQRIAHQVILGADDVRPSLTVEMERMAGRSNMLMRDGASFDAFYAEVGRCLQDTKTAPLPCLMHDSAAMIARGRVGPATSVPTQAGFWFFVLKDAIELHVARTLVMLAAHPEIQSRVRSEIRDAAGLDAQAVGRMQLLEACIIETLRLWTPVPMLLRRATADFTLGDGIRIERGDQLLVHAGHYHRDPRVFGERAHRFAPDEAGAAATPVYVFSAHRQACAGRSLVLFVLKATLASLLDRCRFVAAVPTIDRERIPYLYDHFAVALRAEPDA